MTIKIESIDRAVKKGLTVEEYIYLRVLEDGCEYIFGVFPIGRKDALFLNNLITNTYSITEKGIKLLQEIEEVKEVSHKKDIGVNQLYIACQQELENLTGKKQKTSKINGKSYSFLPNFVDFQSKIEKTVKKYQLNDKEQLKKVLIQYINKCNKENNWFPILEYYITKDNTSKLATDYISFEEGQEIEIKKGDTFNI